MKQTHVLVDKGLVDSVKSRLLISRKRYPVVYAAREGAQALYLIVILFNHSLGLKSEQHSRSYSCFLEQFCPAHLRNKLGISQLQCGLYACHFHQFVEQRIASRHICQRFK